MDTADDRPAGWSLPGTPPDGGPGRLERARDWAALQLARRDAPVWLLGLVVALSIGARTFRLGTPSETSPGQGFIFDEKYYVNAARVMAGVTLPSGDTYSGASPAGTDPNGEHPQLGKMIIAGSIRLFGDGALGWRIGAVLFGTFAILALYWLVRTAGGSAWLALAAATLMAVDNLMLVHSRIAVLDIYCLPLMLAAVALFMRGRWALAGIVIGVACCMKLFAVYALFAIIGLELLRAVRWRFEPWRPSVNWRRVAAPGITVLCFAASFAIVLAIIDHYVPPYHNGHTVASANPWTHLRFMYDYGKELTSPDGPKGIASYPWQFWYDVESANYFTTTVTVRAGDAVTSVDTVVAFQGMVNPVLLALALPAFAYCGWLAIRRRDDLSLLVVVWYLATWLPSFFASVLDKRTCYLYYMVMTLPLICVAVARLLAHRLVPRVALGLWIGLLVAGFYLLYPFRTYPFT